MAKRKRIPGSPGTDPIPAASDEPATPEPPQPRRRPARPEPPAPPARHGHRDPWAELRPAIAAARILRDQLAAEPDRYGSVLEVRAGYKFIDGKITDMPAIVVVVARKRGDLPSDQRLPAHVDGIPTDVAVADPWELLRGGEAGDEAAELAPPTPRLLIDEVQREGEGEAEEAVPQISYEPPSNGDLSPVTAAMTVVCHVSPDAGWRVLKPFLEATKRELFLGMYDFTAPHIYRLARQVLKQDGVEWRQTLGPNESLPKESDVDSTKAEDLTETQVIRGLRRVAGSRFQSAFAHVGAGRTFASAYHIKVAVRDGEAFWLSSGNWQSSNQPDIDFFDVDADRSVMARYNREWHVVVENAALARRFRVFLEHDLAVASEPAPEAAAASGPDLLIPIEEFLAEETARREIEVFAPKKFTFGAAEPLTVQPILTPDNYVEVVRTLLEQRPEKRLYFQNQSLNPVLKPTPEFGELMRLLADYSNDESLDVRIIFRSIGPVRKKLESLKAAGFNMRRIRLQEGCHTKGIVIDSKVVLTGSHNFTNQGIQANRDASLLIRHAGIAGYFERIFLHDWARLGRDRIREVAAVPVGAPGAEAALAGTEADYVRVPWSFLDED